MHERRLPRFAPEISSGYTGGASERWMTDMRLIVVGAGGRMGRTLVKTIAETAGVALAGAVEQPGALVGQDSGVLAGIGPNRVPVVKELKPLLAGADGILDFTTPAATLAFAALCAEAGIVHVAGTTGLSAADEAKLKGFAQKAVVVRSGNMSLGVNLLAALVRRVAASLDDEFDVEILEMHHNKKVDAPSGTALLLGEAAARGRGIDFAAHRISVREGITGPRKKGHIGFAALRGGSVVGEHSVMFAAPGERVELTHRAEDRGIFARGALKAALWARGKPPGLYSMADVLGLTDF
jgi:4-hydroxy-tetrahydrodipicolinate reductase